MFFSTKTCIATIMVLALVLAHQGTVDSSRLFPNSHGCPDGYHLTCYVLRSSGVCRCMRDHRLVDHESTVARNSLVSPQIACPEGQVWIGKFGHCSVK
ncbi:hypothetical protein CFC21_100639 [Triticum aestivum]|uniref:Secreted protein n=4 Tax=Triticum TaxID=4564 RepID=M7YDN3_TRIUA|nr:hypothetical protein TRIUR3_06809 [Triticum urartu]KAF7098949.1 hypothetical protein CFC21_100639 [Triticum aestivum]VAI81622.1 unnamed protein product [Triticum turgidum subsp. durum]